MDTPEQIVSDAAAQAPAPAAAPQAAPPQAPGVPIYDISGQQPVFGHMHPDDVHEAVASGKYSLPKGSTVPAFDPSGTLGDLSADEAPQAFKNGYRYATPDAIDENTHTGAGQQAIAGLEGVAQGIAGPLAPLAERALGVKGEDILAREKWNPTTHGIGEAAGLIGGAFTGTGEAALLEHIGASAAKVLGPKGAGLMAKIGARSLSDATQMALFQGGDEVSKMIEGDPSQTAGSALLNMGHSAVLGGAFGAALGAVNPLWKATVGAKLGQTIEDLKSRFDFLSKNPDLGEALTKELTEQHAGVTSAADEVYGPQGIKAQGISKAMPEMHPGISDQAQDVANKMQERLTKMQGDPYSYPPRLTTKLQGDLDNYLGKVTHPDAGPADIFNAGQDLKQQLQGYSKFEKMLSPVDEGYDFVKDSKDMAHSLRKGLEDTEVWGKAGELQQKVNKAFTEYLPALKDFQSKFGTKVEGQIQIDPGKVQSYLNQVDKPSSSIKKQMLENYLEASEKYKKVIGDVHASLGSESPIQPSSLNVAKSTLQKSTVGSKMADYFVKQGITHLAGEGIGTAVGAGLGSVVGAPGWGAMIGEKALSPFFKSVLPGIVKPIMEKASNSAGLKAAVDYGMAAAKGDAVMSRAAKSFFKAPGMVGEAAYNNQDRIEAQRAKLDNQLKAVQTNPSLLTKNNNDLGHYLPDHANAIAEQQTITATYLNSLRPNTQPTSPLDPKLPPDPIKAAEYKQALDIANNPMLVMDKMHKGTLTPNDIKTLQVTNPGAYKSLCSKLQTEMIAHTHKGETVPYKQRVQLSMFLGAPMDSTMLPGNIMAAQPQAPAPQPATAQTPANAPKRSTSKLGNVAKSARTDDQARDSRGASRSD